MEEAVLKYITNQIKKQSDCPEHWVLFNGAMVKIVETVWDIGMGGRCIQLYPEYNCQGTVSEALYHIEEGTLLYFLTAKI